MKFFTKRKDGGPESHVTGYWLFEIKPLCSIVLLRFDAGSRDAYHSHAFSAWSWLLGGRLIECIMGKPSYGDNVVSYRPSWVPIWTPRSRCHKVISVGTSWVLSIRGPWAKQWHEYIPATGDILTLENGRKVVS